MDLSNFKDKDVLEFLMTLNSNQDKFKGLTGRVIEMGTVKDLFNFMNNRFQQSFVEDDNDKDTSNKVVVKQEIKEEFDGYEIKIEYDVDQSDSITGRHQNIISNGTVSTDDFEDQQSEMDWDQSGVIDRNNTEEDDATSGDSEDGNDQTGIVQDRPHKCSICDHGFKTSSTLKVHIQYKHSTVRPFRCEETNCGKTFKTKANLSQHKRVVHKGDRPHQCNHSGCGLSFVTKQHLLSHQRIHTGERPYRCTVDGCEKTFKRLTHLTNHQRIHSNDRPFKCTEDGCEMAFKRADHLTHHLRTHTNERPFKCTVVGCDKSFSHSSNLTAHLRIHTGEKYHCQVDGCEGKFSHRGNLQRHYKSRHPYFSDDSQRDTPAAVNEDDLPAWEVKEENSDDECQLVLPQVYKTTKQFI